MFRRGGSTRLIVVDTAVIRHSLDLELDTIVHEREPESNPILRVG
jgi:hypothetical protein